MQKSATTLAEAITAIDVSRGDVDAYIVINAKKGNDHLIDASLSIVEAFGRYSIVEEFANDRKEKAVVIRLMLRDAGNETPAQAP